MESPLLVIEINSYEFLTARNFGEDSSGNVRMVVEGATASSETVTLQLGTTGIPDCYPVLATGRIFEIVWKTYIAYCMQNESYIGQKGENEIATGGHFSIYSQSNFLDYVAKGTFATHEYPGPFIHYRVATETHVLDIASVDPPRIRSLESVNLNEPPNLISCKTYAKGNAPNGT
jgi:hypothetical protein